MQVGIDIIEIDRLKIINDDEDKLKIIFTEKEIEYINKFKNKLDHIAGFFCAKEAFSKALKSGFGKDFNALDIEVLHNDSGAPYINVINSKIISKMANKKIELSISHSDTVATAICILY